MTTILSNIETIKRLITMRLLNIPLVERLMRSKESYYTSVHSVYVAQ